MTPLLCKRYVSSFATCALSKIKTEAKPEVYGSSSPSVSSVFEYKANYVLATSNTLQHSYSINKPVFFLLLLQILKKYNGLAGFIQKRICEATNMTYFLIITIKNTSYYFCSLGDIFSGGVH